MSISKDQIEKDIGMTLNTHNRIMKLKIDDKKKYEREFVINFYKELNTKNISLPIVLILKGSDKSEQQISKPVYGMRVMTDSQQSSPVHKKIVENTGRMSTSKGDIAIYTKDREDIAWISHKNKGIYAQILEASADLFKGDAYQELRDFKLKMIQLSIQRNSHEYCWPLANHTSKGLQVWDEIKSKILIGKCIFGFDYGKTYFNRQNVNAFMHGDPELKYDNNRIYLSGSEETLINNDSSSLPKIMMKSEPKSNSTTTIGNNKIFGTSVWIITEKKLPKIDRDKRQIDYIIQHKEELVSNICYQSAKLKPTYLQLNGKDIFFNPSLKNPYDAFYFKNGKKVKYGILNRDKIIQILKKYNRNTIPHGKIINERTGKFIDDKKMTPNQKKITNIFRKMPRRTSSSKIISSSKLISSPKIISSSKLISSPKITSSSKLISSPKITSSSKLISSPKITSSSKLISSPKITSSSKIASKTIKDRKVNTGIKIGKDDVFYDEKKHIFYVIGTDGKKQVRHIKNQIKEIRIQMENFLKYFLK
ncbi:endonuclease [Paramecium bursaria Chlorella virus NYs1]|uniref:Endonuclease n=1 Tax=Paramecium bursaria Chlorella virus NYs1 TaxID=83442 RepID=M1IJF5_9PHYC|nr:endonuclease [Paramecium bursaria Chlorella virus NYs1]AGE58595.1 endonuclease [Paramecium bursaria Chlorella virus NYs1]